MSVTLEVSKLSGWLNADTEKPAGGGHSCVCIAKLQLPMALAMPSGPTPHRLEGAP